MIQNGINKITINTEISKRVYMDDQSLKTENSETTYCKSKNDSDSQMFMVCAAKDR
ncbi:hypothetical protein [Clostridium ljungdahlii]|uniref:hypothetical protein n=1 Tax=Clostridium ljungdahlii TaxID=1538 RepID=UPI0012E88ADB|nr:hypothetical protein [Clostridium ljungdahlii]